MAKNVIIKQKEGDSFIEVYPKTKIDLVFDDIKNKTLNEIIKGIDSNLEDINTYLESVNELTLQFSNYMDKNSASISNIENELILNKEEMLNKLKNININNIELRNEVIDIKLKLEETNLVDFLNKTGVGFYDLFKSVDEIDLINTTAAINNVSRKVTFKNNDKLTFKNQIFEGITEIELTIYDDSREKIQVIDNSLNSNTVNVLLQPNTKNIGDTIIFNGNEYKITAVEKKLS